MSTECHNDDRGAKLEFAVAACSLGALLVARTERGVCAILFGDDADALTKEFLDRYPHARASADSADFDQLMARIVGFIDAPAGGVDVPLDVSGTAFQERVWQALRDIPAGKTESYAAVAKRIGAPGAVRAVARACAANDLAVVIPCHRVVRKDGSPSGYRWGVARKLALLEREAAA